tara:strand:+ start:542 stop:1084 length:543 start_codon:yes stop_codon:yes gene_type:complete
MRILTACVIAITIGVILFPGSSLSATQENVVKVVTNAIKYMRGIDHKDGNIHFVILYQQGDTLFKGKAQQYAAMFHDKNVKRRKVSASYHSTDSLNIALKEAHIVMFVGEVDTKVSEEVLSVAKRKHIMLIGDNKRCAQEAYCAVGFDVGEKTNIYLNEHVLGMLGFDLQAAFRLMVKRL